MRRGYTIEALDGNKPSVKFAMQYLYAEFYVIKGQYFEQT